MEKRRKQDEQLLVQLRGYAARIAAPFGLAVRSLGRTRRDARIYGSCDTEGNIRIRLRSRMSGSFLKESSLVATLCHELAHLRHFDHGREFVRLYRQLLTHARLHGFYRPAGSGRRAPPVVPQAVSPALAAKAPRRRPKRRKRPS